MVGFSDLPSELIQRLYASAGGWNYPLSFKDRLRALAVCRSWRQALRGVPLHRVLLSEPSHFEWAIHTRPAAIKLELQDELAELLAPAALHSFQPEVLEEVESSRLPSTLPRPTAFPNLRALQSCSFTWSSAWLARLTGLEHLRELSLGGISTTPSTELPLSLPRLVHLTSLWLSLPFVPQGTVVRVALHELPSLKELELYGEACSVQLFVPKSGPASSSPLRQLKLLAGRASVDFGGTPMLSSACLWAHELAGADTIARATVLRQLQLASENAGVECDLSAPWVSELLHAAPPSVRCLSICGQGVHRLADTLGSMTQLRALALSEDARPSSSGAAAGNSGSDSDNEAVASPKDQQGMWAGLRALYWCCPQPLPECLRLAVRLNVLDWYAPNASPTWRDMDLLSSMPSLQTLWVEVDCQPKVLKGVARKFLSRDAQVVMGSRCEETFIASVKDLNGD